jgi:hypothetical protein
MPISRRDDVPSTVSHKGLRGSSSLSTQRTLQSLERKRARDRRNQQAVRDRTRDTVQKLTDQVEVLELSLAERNREVASLSLRLEVLGSENAHLQIQIAALDTGAIGKKASEENANTQDPTSLMTPRQAWEIAPFNNAPNCIADQIWLSFINLKRQRNVFVSKNHSAKAAPYIFKPDITSLFDRQRTGDDEISKVASDMVKSYSEIGSMPMQIAIHYIMSLLLNVS